MLITTSFMIIKNAMEIATQLTSCCIKIINECKENIYFCGK